MRRTAIIAALLLMILAGFTLGRLTMRGTAETPVPSERDVKQLSTAELGARLMARIGANFVADTRSEPRSRSALTFFDTPKPFGDWLCRVNAYSIDPKIVTGASTSEPGSWGDDLRFETLYVMWRRPTASVSASRRDQACAHWRDFQKLIRGEDGIAVERGAYVLDKALTALRNGRADFPIACKDIRTYHEEKPCDGRAVLRSLSLRQLGEVKTGAEKDVEGGTQRADELSYMTIRPDGVDEYVDLEIINVQHFGKQSAFEGDVSSIRIVLSRNW
jgi:hypothetical protein